MSHAAKFWTALSAALAVAVTVTADGSLTLNDAITILAAGVGAVGVYFVPNTPRGH